MPRSSPVWLLALGALYLAACGGAQDPLSDVSGDAAQASSGASPESAPERSPTPTSETDALSVGWVSLTDDPSMPYAIRGVPLGADLADAGAAFTRSGFQMSGMKTRLKPEAGDTHFEAAAELVQQGRAKSGTSWVEGVIQGTWQVDGDRRRMLIVQGLPMPDGGFRVGRIGERGIGFFDYAELETRLTEALGEPRLAGFAGPGGTTRAIWAGETVDLPGDQCPAAGQQPCLSFVHWEDGRYELTLSGHPEVNPVAHMALLGANPE